MTKTSYKKTVLTIDSLSTSLNKADKTASSLNKTMKKVDDSTKNIQSLNKSFESFNTKLLDSSGMNKINDLKNNFSNFIIGVKKGEITFISVFNNIKKSLFSIAIPIVFLTGAFMILKRMFTLNIGGMQTSFFQFIGKIKYLWATFQVRFNKSLMEISSIVKPLIKLFFDSLLPIAEGLFAILDVFNKMPKTLKIITLGVIAIGVAMSAGPLGGFLIVGGALLMLLGKFPKVLKFITIAIGALSVALLVMSVASGGVIPAISLIILGIYGLYKGIRYLLTLLPSMSKGTGLFAKNLKVLFIVLNVIKTAFIKTFEYSPIGLMLKGVKRLIDYFGGLKKILSFVWDGFTKAFWMSPIGLIIKGTINIGQILFSSIKNGMNLILDGILGTFDSLPLWAKKLIGIEPLEEKPVVTAPKNDKPVSNNTSNNQTYNTSIYTTQAPNKVMEGMGDIMAKSIMTRG